MGREYASASGVRAEARGVTRAGEKNWMRPQIAESATPCTLRFERRGASGKPIRHPQVGRAIAK